MFDNCACEMVNPNTASNSKQPDLWECISNMHFCTNRPVTATTKQNEQITSNTLLNLEWFIEILFKINMKHVKLIMQFFEIKSYSNPIAL